MARVRLAKEVRCRREAADLSQVELAGRLGVSQPRITPIESAASVSLDTVLLAYLAVGGSFADLAGAISLPVAAG